jgi:hypothetical protein
MPRNNKNSATSNSNLLELLVVEENGTEDDTGDGAGAAGATSATSAWKRTQLYDPESPPRKKSVLTKTKATRSATETNEDPLL